MVRVAGGRGFGDARIRGGDPTHIRAAGAPLGRGQLPGSGWLAGKPAVIWRTRRAPDGFPCRIERIGAEAAECDALHRQSGVWSPFNYELSARLMRGRTIIGLSPGERFTIGGDGSISASQLDRAGRVAFLIEELGISEEIASRVPDDRPAPPRPEPR